MIHFDFACVISQSLECSWGYCGLLCKTHQKSGGGSTGHWRLWGVKRSKDTKLFFGKTWFTDGLTLFSGLSFGVCMDAIRKDNHKRVGFGGIALCQCPYAGLQTKVLKNRVSFHKPETQRVMSVKLATVGLTVRHVISSLVSKKFEVKCK